MFFRSSKSSNKSKKTNAPLESPLEARRRKLAEEERKLREQTTKHEKFIETAPQIAARKQQEQRDAYLRNAARASRLNGPAATVLPDVRMNSDIPMASSRARRRDRQRGKWMFFVLVALLFLSAWWAWHMLYPNAFPSAL
jgi:hypothetical protein